MNYLVYIKAYVLIKHEENFHVVKGAGDNTDEFQNLAKDRFVMLKADFPRRKKNQLSEAQESHNKSLASKYNPNGYFPYVVVLDPSGKVLGQSGYEKTSPKAYFNKLNSF